MKRLLVVMAALMMTAGLCMAEEWVGYVSDKKCAKPAESHAECARNCVKDGQPIVFVNDLDKKVYDIHNPDAVKDHVGHKVTLTGKADGDSIHVNSVKM